MTHGGKEYTDWKKYMQAKYNINGKDLSQTIRWSRLCKKEPLLLYINKSWNWITKRVTLDEFDKSILDYAIEIYQNSN